MKSSFEVEVTMKRMEAFRSLTLGLVLLAVPMPSYGQPPAKVYRIGYLTGGVFQAADLDPQHCPIKGRPNWQAFLEGMREHGYVRDRNFVIGCRNTEGWPERAPALAAELVNLKPDLIVAISTPNTRALKQATSTIPIVMVGVYNPVEGGLVASLARPGGNVTGVAENASLELMAKNLQLLKEAMPRVSRVAVLGYSPNPTVPIFWIWSGMQEAAQALDVTLQAYPVGEPSEFEGAFAAMIKARVEALLVLPNPLLFEYRKRIVELAAQNRLPALYPYREAVQAGGLMSYDASLPDEFRRLGYYVDKIFKGAKPADLPVEQPTKFELVINLRTAKALGLTIPQSLLLRADEVIQ
jgi:putative ABC transport system substrate-binding protein